MQVLETNVNKSGKLYKENEAGMLKLLDELEQHLVHFWNCCHWQVWKIKMASAQEAPTYRVLVW